MNQHLVFGFAEIRAKLIIHDEINVVGYVSASGFDGGGEYQPGNICNFMEMFESPHQRDEAIARCLAFCSVEMHKRAKWNV